VAGTGGDYEALVRLFKAMGHPTRLGLLKRISVGTFCVSELHRHLDQSQSSTSQHLAILRDRGLVVPDRRGNMTCYSLADERLVELLALAEKVVGPEPRDAVPESLEASEVLAL
jgi:ArsR family transcriptional regulator